MYYLEKFDLESTALKEAVKGKLRESIVQATQMNKPEMIALANALLGTFNEIATLVDWSLARSKGEIKTVVGSLVAAIHLSYQSMDGEYEELYGTTDAEVWSSIILEILSHPNSAQVFKESVWRSPVIVSPMRGLPLEYILGHHFRNATKKELVGVDLGTGLHVTLPLLGSDEFLEADFPGKADIAQYAGNISLRCAVGVDKQPREKTLAWAQACYWPLADNKGSALELAQRYSAVATNPTFPFVQASVLDLEVCRDEVLKHTGEPVDFVFSSFVRHQLGTEPEVQNRFEQLVLSLLSENGIWIDLGQELLRECEFATTAVHVYKKCGTRLELVGIPFILKGQTNIGETNLNYFSL